MRLLLGIAAAVVALAAAIVLWPSEPAQGAEPIAYGRDTCARCRMHISQPGWGGELRDKRGVLTKYDDVGCMLIAMWAMHAEVPEAWVEDKAGGGFVPLLGAALVRGEGLGTPMGYGVVAFAQDDAAERFARERGGERVTLEELLRDSGRFGTKHAEVER